MGHPVEGFAQLSLSVRCSENILHWQPVLIFIIFNLKF